MKLQNSIAAIAGALAMLGSAVVGGQERTMVFEAGHPSLQQWLLPDQPPSPGTTR